jgi:peptide/nickel transport system ATP-binding protein
MENGASAAGARLLDVRDLSIHADIGGSRRTIVSGLTLHLNDGETIGIVGESGSGKSLTARALAGLLPRNVSADGAVAYEGRQLLGLSGSELAKVRGTEISLLLQNPFTLLNPLLRCGAHIEEGLGAMPRGRRERAAEAARRLAEVGIDEPGVAQRYPFQLSGGMQQRVGLAAALARDPRVLIADEPTTALDVTTQGEIVDLLKSLQAQRGMGLILITHDLRLAFATCDRLYVLYAGALLETGSAADVEEEPLHPYSLGLLLSEPSVDERQEKLLAIPGSVPAHDEVVDRCAFSTRCDWAAEECVAQRPGLAVISPGRETACVRITEIRPQLAARRRHVGPSLQVVVQAMQPLVAQPVVDVVGLVKTFPGDVQALKGVSICAARGESVGIVGESGSGKSTLARCLLGLERPTAGRISIARIDASDFDAVPGADRRRLRTAIQIVFQDPYSSLNPALTVKTTLSEAIEMRGKGGGSVSELLEQVGLPAEYARRKPAALSGGERQRVAIARALAVEPEILVCDEPVSALDVSVQAQILNLLGELRERLGLTYVFITHDLAVVRQVVDRAYVFRRGEIVEEGPVEQILERPKHPYTARLLEAQTRLAERPGDAKAELAHAAN